MKTELIDFAHEMLRKTLAAMKIETTIPPAEENQVDGDENKIEMMFGSNDIPMTIYCSADLNPNKSITGLIRIDNHSNNTSLSFGYFQGRLEQVQKYREC